MKEGIPAEIREQKTLSDSVGEVLLTCCSPGLLLSCTSTQASLSGEPVATVTDLSFFIIGDVFTSY